MRVVADQAFTTDEVFALMPFTMKRGTAAGSVEVIYGDVAIQQGDLTIGWAGAGTTLEMEITSSTLGAELTVTASVAGIHTVDVEVELLW